VSKRKTPRPSGGTDEQGKGKDSRTNDCNRHGAKMQDRVFSLLLEGEENAIPAADLAKLAGFKDQRTLRRQIDCERENGCFILASANGYFRPDSGQRGLLELRRFVRRTDARAASNRRTIKKIREALRAAERAPLEGQQDLWGGGDT